MASAAPSPWRDLANPDVPPLPMLPWLVSISSLVSLGYDIVRVIADMF